MLTGALKLKIKEYVGGPGLMSWSGGPRRRLEEILNDVIARMVRHRRRQSQ